MTARLWRGFAAADFADEVAAHLRDVTVAQFATMPGNVSAELLRRDVAGGVELMTLSVWETADAVPRTAEEAHRLLLGRQTIPACWELVSPTATAVAAAA